jgi:hypothetical protein
MNAANSVGVVATGSTGFAGTRYFICDGAGSINGSRSLMICLTSSASTISSAANPPGAPVLDINVPRLGDEMIQSLDRHLDNVIIGIVGNAEQRQPLRFDLIAKAERGDLDFGLFAFEHDRDAIEERAPLFFVELAGRHADLLFGQGSGMALSMLAPVLIANEPTTTPGAVRLDQRSF